jgi:hypothetical protein
MRPITKPSTSAAKISKAIITAKLIGLSPLGQGHYPATQRLLNPFWQNTHVQTAVDTKNHLIVAHEVTNVGTDHHQLSNIAEQARTEMGVETLDAVADRGYYAGEEIRACEESPGAPQVGPAHHPCCGCVTRDRPA